MAITRVTQHMLSQRSLSSVQGGLNRMAKVQEQLETGRKLNRASDSPADANTAMRVRSSLADQQQYARNAADGVAWLSTIDSTLGGIVDEATRARTLALQGANTGAMSQTALDALATEVDQIRESVLQQANTTYLGRPVFGGTVSGDSAFDSSGTYVGDGGSVERRMGDDVKVRVDADGIETFGENGNNLFTHLADLSAALRSGNGDAIRAGAGALNGDLTKLSAAMATEGARYNRLTQASDLAGQAKLQLTKSRSDVEDIDLAAATIELQTQQVAYQAALAATGRTIQPSLLDFLR